MLLILRTAALGAVLVLGIACGAIFGQLTKLGFTIRAVDDRGELFGQAMTILLGSLMVPYCQAVRFPSQVRDCFPKHENAEEETNGSAG